MKTFPVSILQSDIDSGIQDSTNRCMLARAIRREYGATHIYINAGIIRFNYNGVRHYCNPPAEASIKLSKFDESKKMVKPFTLTLTASATSVIVQLPTKTVKQLKAKRTRSANKFKTCKNRRFTSGSYNKKLKKAA